MWALVALQVLVLALLAYRIGRHAMHLLGRFPSFGRTDPNDDCSVVESVDAYAARLSRDAYVLRGISRLASTLTMLAIVLELGWGLAGGSGLMGLQAGLPERAALALALASACAGAGSVLLYLRWAGRMRALSGATVRQLRDLARVSLDRAHEPSSVVDRASRS